MQIEIYSDTICPWCLIGKRRLQRALKERPQPDVELIWRAFQLNPNMPAEGIDRQRYMELKFGDAERARQVYEPVVAAGQSENLPFDFSRMTRTPNTVASHRLIHMARERGLGDAAAEALFVAYFFESKDIGNLQVLASLAQSIGLPADEIAERLRGSDSLLDVLAEDAKAREIGIQGVPTFIFNGKYLLSGAQPPEVMFQIFELVTTERSAPLASP